VIHGLGLTRGGTVFDSDRECDGPEDMDSEGELYCADVGPGMIMN